ncbi:MAG TPA: hypothetical protein PKD03_15225, partial [Ignavibacteriaceae bacterium]|nr:hypothetical protein [Ignavibacteriaceae bacterium]
KENTAAYCFIGEIDLPKTADGILVVGNECDFENCSGTYGDIQLQVIRQFNNFEYIIGERIDTITVCAVDSGDTTRPTGSSTPVPYDRLMKKYTKQILKN